MIIKLSSSNLAWDLRLITVYLQENTYFLCHVLLFNTIYSTKKKVSACLPKLLAP